MLEFLALAQQCSPQVDPDTMRRIVHVESAYNPYAIGVVGARLKRQPKTHAEAMATARWLDEAGYNYSVGLAQVNKNNFTPHGLTIETAFNPCENLRAGAAILTECFQRAETEREEQRALQAAWSCYYSGNFTTGFRRGYVERIIAANGPAKMIVPRFEPTAGEPAATPIALEPRRDRSPHKARSPDKPRNDADQSKPASPSPNRSALIF